VKALVVVAVLASPALADEQGVRDVEALMAGAEHAKSFALAQKLCTAGDKNGCALVGLHQQDGLGTSYDPAAAKRSYEAACKAGAGVACFNLAGMHHGGHGISVDAKQGDAYMKLAKTAWEAQCNGTETRWCTNLAYVETGDARLHALNKRACDGGFVVGCTEAARYAYALKQLDDKAFEAALDKQCTAGEANACTTLAARKPERAPKLLARGCTLGEKYACWKQGLERAGAKDWDGASKAFGRACDRAYAEACVALAQKAVGGKDVPRGIELAKRACHMGNAKGCSLVAMLAKTEVIPWATAGCRMGDGESCQILVEKDVLPLPTPPDVQRRFLDAACTTQKLASACKRLRN